LLKRFGRVLLLDSVGFLLYAFAGILVLVSSALTIGAQPGTLTAAAVIWIVVGTLFIAGFIFKTIALVFGRWNPPQDESVIEA
jgi:hypothetical protein